MEDLLLIFIIAIIFMSWWHQRGMKDGALVTTHALCQKKGLQLLDETVQLSSVRPARNRAGNWVLRRRYRFEFTSTGGERYQGEAVLCGLQFEALELPPYAVPADWEEKEEQDKPTLH